MRRRTVFMITGIGVHDPPESVFTIDWNLSSRSNGIGVHDPPESAHAFIHGHFHPRRHLIPAETYREIRSKAFRVWRRETCVQYVA